MCFGVSGWSREDAGLSRRRFIGASLAGAASAVLGTGKLASGQTLQRQAILGPSGALALTGATDTVSMVIRNIVRQLETPDRLRGRMTGVNMVFFAGGPQLGEMEAGVVANWFGAPFSVVSGGVGCLLATAWVAASTPALRHYVRGRAAHGN